MISLEIPCRSPECDPLPARPSKVQMCRGEGIFRSVVRRFVLVAGIALAIVKIPVRQDALPY